MNTFIYGKGKKFWISYNPITDKGAETALCKEIHEGIMGTTYLILLGDYRKDFKPFVKLGYSACLKKFNQLLKNGAEKSPWSN